MFSALIANARIGIQYELALGNPSGAVTDSAQRTNYLISRDQYALSYNDDTHQANWVSWSYTASDSGSSGRTDAWAIETELPAGYLRIGTSSFGTGWDRGHMCPSADRTVSVADNEFTFRMSNMIPQASSNNQGLWANFESYCRGLTSDGSEVMVVSGPSGFSGSTISNGMQIPSTVWKIAIKIPDGSNSAALRVNSNCRVIAIATPNTSSGLGSWQSYITSVEQIEESTGLHFFTAVDPATATYLKNVVDTGTGANSPTVITSVSPGSGAVGATVGIAGYNFGSSPVVRFNGVSATTTVLGPNSLSTVVPTGATTGFITVTGTSGTDTSASQFNVLSVASPVLTLSTQNLSGFSATQGTASAMQTYTVSGSSLTGGITVTAPTYYELSLDGLTYTGGVMLSPNGDGTLSGLPVHVRLSSSAPLGTVGGSITHSGGGASPQTLSLTGSVDPTTPTLALSTQTLSGFSATAGAASASKSYTVSGTNLSGPVTIAASTGFELSADDLTFGSSLVLTPSGGSLTGVAVRVRIASSAAAGTVSGIISHSGGGVSTQNLTVSGTVSGSSGTIVKLATWETSNLTAFGPSPYAPTSSDPGVSVVGLTRGAGVSITSSGAAGCWGGNGFDGTATTTDAITRGDYATFSITAANGMLLSFDKIPAYNIRRSSTGPTTGQWQYQVGSAGSFVNIGSPITWGSVTTSTGNPQTLVDLSGYADLKNIAGGVTVSFRLVAYGATSSSGTFYINNITGDDLAITGSAAAAATSNVPVVASATSASATSYESFTYQITASHSPTSFASTILPDGLSLDTATGIISGTPRVTGLYHVVLTASNADGDGTAELVISISANPGAPVIGGTLTSTARLRSAFEYQIQSTNSPTAWLASNLPSGLSINTATGLISGISTETGTFAVSITVQNSLGSDSKTLNLTSVDPTLTLAPATLAAFSTFSGSPSAVQTYTVSGTGLAGSITLQAPDGFEMSTSGGGYLSSLVLAPTGSNLATTTISVRLAATAPIGDSSGSIIHSGGGAIPRYLQISGTVTVQSPTLALSVPSLDGFSGKTGSPSFSQNYTVAGASLTGPVTVTAPANYEISLNDVAYSTSLVLTPANGTLSSIPVYVRLSATAAIGSATGSIMHTGGGAAEKDLTVTGVVTGATGPLITSTTSGSVYVGGTFNHPITVDGTPTMLGYAATGLPAGLSINTTTGVISGTPTAAGSSVINLSATSTGGTTVGTYTLKVVSSTDQAAVPLSVVVNKFVNATTDKVELLVTGDTVAGPPVDMRGMILKDFNSNMGSDLGGRLIFKSIPLWASVKAGTLIVLSAGQTAAVDADPSDFVLRLNLDDPNFFLPGGGAFDIGNTEMVIIKPADCGVDGVAGAIHALAVGSSGSQYSLYTGRKVRSPWVLGQSNGTFAYIYNSRSKLSDFYSGSEADTTYSLTFGSANSTPNNTFINSLRALDQDAPVVTLAGTSPMTIPLGGTYNDPGAAAVDAKDGARTVTSTGIVNTQALGSYTITYSATDSSGNIGTATRTVFTTDQSPPVVTLVGSPTMRIPTGQAYQDPGAAATDAVDGTVAPHVTGSVNTNAPGAYVLTYTATDAAGNVSIPVMRTVTVVAAFDFMMKDTYGLTGANAGPRADPDGDGWTNSQEFAFGMNPTIPGGRLMTSSLEGGMLKLRFLERSGVTYQIESSTDLKTWTKNALPAAASTPQPPGMPTGYTQYDASAPISGGNQYFRIQAVITETSGN